MGWFDMVWLLTAALIAGITQRVCAGFLVAAIFGVTWWGVRGRAREAVALAALASTCVVYGAFTMRAFEEERAVFEAAFTDDGVRNTVAMVGRVEGFPRASPYGTSFRFVGRVEDGAMRGACRLRLLVRAVRFDVDCGDSLRIAARAVRTPRSVRSLFADGVVGVVRAGPGETVRLSRGGRSWLWRAHRCARERLSRRLGHAVGLPLALLLGERGFVDRRTRDTFARLGISHLLALSGMHLGLVVLMVWLALRLMRTSPRRADWIVAAVVAAYVGVVGDLHSLRRAFAMAMLIIGARVVQRPANVLGALARALFILLAARPPSLYSVGFQLSFVATFAVVLAVRYRRSAKRGTRAGRALEGALTTVIAGVHVLAVAAPLQLHYFGVVSLLSPIATLVFLPAAGAVLGLSAVAVILAPVPVAGSGAFAALEWAATTLAAAVGSAALHAPGPLALPPPDVRLYALGVLLVVLGGRRRAAWVAGVVVAAASFTKSCGL